MAIQEKNNVEAAPELKEKVVYTVRVLKATPRKNKAGCYRFNLDVNGITIYGMDYITYTAKSGDERCFIAFPQYQSSDNNYYNHVYFPINAPEYADVFSEIERQIGELLD